MSCYLRDMSWSAGDMIGQRFRLESPLGEGGYGVVWRATELGLNRAVAIKFLRADVADDRSRRRFEREAAATSRLQHPNCVTLLEFGQHQGTGFLVTEYMDGVGLSEWASGRSRREVVQVIGQVLEALEYAHQNHVVHRDLKPSNIVVTAAFDGPRARILDFGMASITGDKRGDITKTGEFIGTPGYVAPEQLRGMDAAGPASDLYSVGVMLWELLSGRPLFEAPTPLALSVLHLMEPAPALQGEHPAHLVTLTEALLSKDPAHRPRTASVARNWLLNQDVERPDAEEGEFEPAVVALPPEPAPPSRTRAAVYAAPVAVTLIAAAAVFGGSEESVEVGSEESAEVAPPPTVASRSAPASPPPRTRPAPRVEEDLSRAEPTSTGCGSTPPPTDERGVVWDSQQAPTTMARLPKAYDSTVSAPAIVLIPRSGVDPQAFIDESGFGDVADEHRLVLIAPAQSDGWDVDDAAGVAAGIEWAKETLCLRADRLIAVGDADGGLVAETLLCAVSSFAVLVTQDYRSTDRLLCRPSAPVAYLSFRSNSNRLTDPGGTWKFPDSESEHIRRWSRQNNCDLTFERSTPWRGARCDGRWVCDALVERCVVDNDGGWTRPEAEGPSPMAAYVVTFFVNAVEP